MGRKHKKKAKKKKEKEALSFMDQLQAAIGERDWDKAENLLKPKIEKQPSEFLHYLLGYVYRCASGSENNKLEEALQQQETALELCEDKNKAGWFFYEMGKIYKNHYFENKDDDKALEYFQKAIACEETPSDAYFEIVLSYDFEQIDEKIKIYKMGIERFPKERRFYLDCAFYLSNHKFEDSEAEKILLSALENGIVSSAVYDNLGEIKVKQEMYDEAVLYYKKIFSLEDFANLHARTNFKIATIYLRNEEYNIAEEYLMKSLEGSDDEDVKHAVYFGLIFCYQKTDRGEQAIELLRKFDFNREFDEEYQFCGWGYMSLGVEDYPLDYGMGYITYSDIITNSINSLEDFQDQFDDELNHAFFLLKALLLESKGEFEECLTYLKSALSVSDSGLLWKAFQSVFESMLYEGLEYKKGRALTQYLKLFKETLKDFPVLTPILGGNVRDELVEQIFKAKKYKEIVNICEIYGYENLDGILFEAAYSYNETQDQETSKELYEKYLEENPESNAALNNLANIYKREGRIEEAIELYERAVEADPDDTIAPNNLKIILDQRDELLKKERKAKKTQEIKAQVQKVAAVHWPSLDFYKKKVLMVLNTIDGFSGFDELASLCNMEERWVKGHYNKLLKLGMVIEEKGSFRINPEISPLIERESSHSVAISVIRSDSTINFKPIFNSKLEFNIYRLMIGLFPNHLIFPNMSLQSIFTYDRMKNVLDSDLFQYYLLTSVDICIVSTANYLPILGYEVDSPYHDNPDQIARDEKKNEIFKLGGVPLIRLRPHGQPSDMEIRESIITRTRDLGRSLDPLEKRNEMIFQLLKNLD